MPRKIIVEGSTGPVKLTESLAKDEEQLQELLKNNPDLLPIEDFGMTGPAMVVGRETRLASGGVDLVALARSGELMIIEFKTGPQNTDFRAAIAQLLDYGSDMWRMTFDEFEGSVSTRYFAGRYCLDARLRNLRSLLDAARIVWTDLSEDEAALLRERVTRQLETGAFHYMLVAQRFTATTERTVQYMNAAMAKARFYAVEVVRFVGDDGLEAFESRTVYRPSESSVSTPTSYTDEAAFLEKVEDEAYRDTLKELFEACRGLGLRFEWGAKGTPLQLPNPDRSPLAVGWAFPPGELGWMSLTNLTLGYDSTSAVNAPTIAPALERYTQEVSRLAGAQRVTTANLVAHTFSPASTVALGQQIIEVLANLVEAASTSA